jgi:hypothetical protein
LRDLGGLASVILNLGIRWRWVVSFMLWSLSLALPVGCKGGYASEQVLTVWRRGKYLSLARNEPQNCSVHRLFTLKQLLHEQVQLNCHSCWAVTNVSQH